MKKPFHLFLIVFLLISCSDEINSPNFEVSEHILSEYSVTSIAFDSKNFAWIGTYWDGLIKYNGTTTVYNSTNSNLPDSLFIRSVAVDNNDVVWLASDKGLIKYENGTFHIYDKSNAPLFTNSVFALTIDKDNSIWFTSCTLKEGGIMKFDGTNWDLFTPQNSKLPGSLTIDITTDNKNNIWALSAVSGANSIVKINSNNFTIYDEKETNIPLNYLGSIAVGQDNVIYASFNYMLSSSYVPTRPNIIMYNGNDWKVIDPVDINGNSLGYVSKIATDLNGNLWTSTSQGLVVYDGVKWSKINTNIEVSYLRDIATDNNNRVWVTGNDGIIIFE